MTHVLYLHGFLSSPQSVKAQATKAWFQTHRPDVTLHIPQLSNYPAKVKAQILSLIDAQPAFREQGLKVIGSSMGGFLATWLVESFGGKAALVNPAVAPYELLKDFLGKHVNPYSGEEFELVADDMAFLREMDSPQIRRPESYHVMLQMGDETLDYRDAERKYQSSALVIEEGGDHSFTTYDTHLPSIAAFLLEE